MIIISVLVFTAFCTGVLISPIPPPPPCNGKAPKEIHAILTEKLVCFLPGRAKDLSAPLYIGIGRIFLSQDTSSNEFL